MFNDLSTRLAVAIQGYVADLQQRIRDDRGATTTEYIIILGIIAIVCVALFNGQIRQALESLGTRIVDEINKI